MTVPIISALSSAYPHLDITILSAGNTQSLFNTLLPNITFRKADFKKDYIGIKGLYRLSRELKHEHFDLVADLHDVLRSQFIRTALKISGAKTAHINKGRNDKKQLCKQGYQQSSPLKTSFQRYADVFSQHGLPIDINNTPQVKHLPLPQDFNHNANNTLIGIAPFAKHQGKIYPLDKMQQVIAQLSTTPNTEIFLFGFGTEEDAYFSECTKLNTNIHNLAGKYKMIDELAIMQRLSLMITMDSANLHLASIAGTPIISIWGATHHYAGFNGWQQPIDNIVELPLPCRPCSVFGNKPCRLGDYRCMHNISPETIVCKANDNLNHLQSK